jgi:hypothetical protein
MFPVPEMNVGSLADALRENEHASHALVSANYDPSVAARGKRHGGHVKHEISARFH